MSWPMAPRVGPRRNNHHRANDQTSDRADERCAWFWEGGEGEVRDEQDERQHYAEDEGEQRIVAGLGPERVVCKKTELQFWLGPCSRN